MIASSRPVYSPTSTVVFAVPISTAPMKVVLELTLGPGLRGSGERKKFRACRRRGGARRRRWRGRRLLDHHRHLTAEGKVHARRHARMRRELFPEEVELRDLL